MRQTTAPPCSSTLEINTAALIGAGCADQEVTLLAKPATCTGVG